MDLQYASGSLLVWATNNPYTFRCGNASKIRCCLRDRRIMAALNTRSGIARSSMIKAIVDGARWVIEDHRQHPGPAVANWSFIADTSTAIPALDTAVADLRAAGIPVIVSAGNLEIDACRVSPGNSRGAIVVGASALVNERLPNGVAQLVDRRSPGTAYGPCIDMYAPGDSVLLPSLDREQSPISQLWNGTSMSAGYVSGAAALYLETHPSATPDEVADELKNSATINLVRDARTTFSRMLYVGTRDTRLLARTASRR